MRECAAAPLVFLRPPSRRCCRSFASPAACRASARCIYGAVFDRAVPVSFPPAAKMTRRLASINCAGNSGLVKTLKTAAGRSAIDGVDPVEAAATSPLVLTACYPGRGLKSHCITADIFYLLARAREYGPDAHFIEPAGETNRIITEYAVDRARLRDSARLNIDPRSAHRKPAPPGVSA